MARKADEPMAVTPSGTTAFPDLPVYVIRTPSFIKKSSMLLMAHFSVILYCFKGNALLDRKNINSVRYLIFASDAIG
jgi:hypothetical protein